MSAHVLLQSPVGRMPMAARWYLAGISMLALVLVAVHFALQVTTQQLVHSYASEWAARSGAELGAVRLRMLRGAMTIDGVRWHGEGASVELPFLLLRGHFAASGPESRLTEIVFRRADIHIDEAFDAGHLSMPKWLAPILTTVRQVDGGGELHIAASQKQLPYMPVWLHQFHYSLHGLDQVRQWKLEGSLYGGKVRLHGSREGVAWHLDGLDSEKVGRALHLAALRGRVGGSGRQQGEILHGELSLDLANSEEQGRVAWQGSRRKDALSIDIHSRHWPLALAAPFAPQPGEIRLLSGYLDGVLHLQARDGSWQVRLPDTEIRGLVFANHAQGERKSGLYVRHMRLVDGVLEWPQKFLRASHIEAQDASLVLEEGIGKPLGDWQVACADVVVEQLRPGIHHGDSIFWLPDLSGKLALAEGGRLGLSLATAAGQEESWRLEGDGTLSPKTAWVASLRVEGVGIPFVRLRPLLDGHLADAREMEGSFDLAGDWHFGAAPGHFSGEIKGHDVALQLDGRQWGAAEIRLSADALRPAVPAHFSSIEADDWFGHVPLRPMLSVPMEEPEQQQLSWLGGWQVDVLRLRNGRVSIGQLDADWLTGASITLAPVVSGQTVGVRMQGALGEGKLALDGKWFPWGTAPHFGGEAQLRDALPFMLNDWLHVSGLPRLMRGRISAKIRVRDDAPLYSGALDVELAHAALEGGAFGDDPLPRRAGYRAIDLFERLGAATRAKLHVPLEGRWSDQPLGWSLLAGRLLQALGSKADGSKVQVQKQVVPLVLSHIRLYRQEGLQHNERVRLRTVIAYLREHHGVVVELLPQIGDLPLDDELVERVRSTQRHIESFMVERGVAPGRIVPIWPTELQRGGESTGIRIQAVM